MTQRMRIGINALFLALGKMAGIETYLRALVRELPALDPSIEYVLFTERKNAGSFGIGHLPNIREVVCPVPTPPDRRALWAARIAYEYTALPRQARRHGIDLLFSPMFFGPARPAYASVITIHDAQHMDLPENFSPLDRALYTRLIRRAARAAAQVLTVSEHAKGRIVAVYNVPPERVTVTHEAADPVYFVRVPAEAIARVRQTYGLHEPYILSVATLQPHKNLDVLIDAYAALRQQGATTAQLALVGLRSVGTAALEAKIRATGLASQIVLPGWVPDADMPALYQGATAFVMPSRYEGFGLPVLEAMASGTPVVATTATAVPEVAGDAALLVHPDDRDGFADALQCVLGDSALRERLIAAGAARARLFSWSRTAEATLATLLRALPG